MAIVSKYINKDNLCLSGSFEIIQSLLDSLAHRLLAFTNPHSGIKIFLVGFIVSVRITDLRRDIILLAEHVISNSGAISILQICVEIDLDDTVRDCRGVFVLSTSTAAMEHKETVISQSDNKASTEAYPP